MPIHERGGRREFFLAGSGPAPAARITVMKKLVLFGAAIALATACISLTEPTPGQKSETAETQDAKAPVATLGLIYAENACAPCHAVTAGQTRSPDPKAPTFKAIANTPGMTTMALNVWLHSPHKSMPLVSVDPDKIEGLSDYLYALKDK